MRKLIWMLAALLALAPAAFAQTAQEMTDPLFPAWAKRRSAA